MTEQEWLESTNPARMLYDLRGKVSDRKLRLAACATCRSVWRFLNKASRRAVVVGEQMADEPVDETYRNAVVQAAIEAVCRFEEMGGEFFMAADIAYRVPCNDGWYAAEWTIGNWSDLSSCVPVMRDVFGNPFRPASLNATWLSWNYGTIQRIAQSIYDDRAFDHMPILADALEEAGCADQSILDHCRSGGEHVRGCWVVDLLLGKE